MMGYHGYKLVIARVVCYKLKLNFVIPVVTALCPHFFFFFALGNTKTTCSHCALLDVPAIRL